MPRCVALNCSENGKHSFPKDLCLKKRWEQATKIKKFKATRSSRLCQKHFKESDYQEKTITGGSYIHRYLKKSAIPSIFSGTKEESASAAARQERYNKRLLQRELFPPQTIDTPASQDQPIPVTCVPDLQMEIEVCGSHQNVEVEMESNLHSVKTQTPALFRLLSSDELLSDPKSVLFYTGLENINKFRLVLSTLLPMANHLNYRNSQVMNLSVEDQFLIMLIKLRRNKEDFELGKLFGISTTEVGNVFVTWINFVYELWIKVDIWPSRELVSYYMPVEFQHHFPSTRVIVDGTEIPIAKPKNPTSQQATFSSYKHHNTIKFLVGCTPGGLLCFCSEGYAGSTSDRQITERSSLLTKCDPKDSIMADRGFNVQDLFEHKNISVKTPTFLRGLSQLPGLKLKNDRKLARKRIHIERLIGLVKTFKILKIDVNPYYVPLLSRIFFVCMMLSNFKEGIVK